jgi:predicted nucleic acid-binding protein
VVLVDSSVWIDFFRGAENAQTAQLSHWLAEGDVEIGVADLIIYEVLRGFNPGKSMRAAQTLMQTLPLVALGGLDNSLLAAEHYRELRSKGYTIRSPIDALLASYCITHGHALLHRDADFEVLEMLRGLKVWKH